MDLDAVDERTLVLTWQAEAKPDEWTPVATGAAFTPGDGEVGSRLRVVATFRDFDGVLESVTSPATAAVGNVNDAPTGVPVLDDRTPTEGAPVTVVTGSIADLDGLEGVTLQRQWQRGDGTAWQNIPAATGATFTPGAAEVGLRLRVVVTFTDNGGTAERVLSARDRRGRRGAGAAGARRPGGAGRPGRRAGAPRPGGAAGARAGGPAAHARRAGARVRGPAGEARGAGRHARRARRDRPGRHGPDARAGVRPGQGGPHVAHAAPPARHPGAAARRQVPRRAHARHEPPQLGVTTVKKITIRR